MILRYQASKKGTGNFGAYMGLDSMMTFLKGKVDQTDSVRIQKASTNQPGPVLSRFEAFRRLRNRLENGYPGDKWYILVDTSPSNWAVRVAEYNPLPDSFLSGVASIDRIATDVYDRFNDKYGIVNLGVCVDKDGEHGVCNAIDIGVSKPKTAEAIHAAILDIGNYLRNRMLADMQGEPGLPVNGIIVMEQIASREEPSWRAYYGIPHVSHVHVSGWPNLVPGWV